MKTKLLIIGLALMATTAIVSAQDPGKRNCNGRCNGTGKGVAYVDNNKNGVCDNYENRKTGSVNGQKKDSTNCKGNGRGKGTCKGKNFIDANKNGVCDHAEKPVQSK